jgi:hypothetical protein
MTSRDELLKRIRSLARGTRGRPPAILELPDATVCDIVEQMERKVSNRAIARFLRKNGMSGSENSLQQTLSLFRKRIAPLLGRESAPPSLPQAALKIPSEVSCLPADEMLATVTDIVKNYGEVIRQQTEAAAHKGGTIGEDLAKHAKAYAALVTIQARLQATVVKSRPVGPTEDPSFKERADRAWEQITDNGRDTDSMGKIVDRFLMKLEKKCISLEQDSNGEWVEAPRQRPGRREANTKTDAESPIN